MKPSLPAPISVARLNSLRDRLEKTPGPEDDPYLDQLMIFLDNPPPNVGDRWKAGAEMCAQWGVSTSGASVLRLYLGYVFEWRTRIALGEELKDASLYDLRVHFARLVSLRACEVLANPTTSTAVIVKLARLEQREKALELAYQRHDDHQEALVEQKRDERRAHAEAEARGEEGVAVFRAMMGMKPSEPKPPIG